MKGTSSCVKMTDRSWRPSSGPALAMVVALSLIGALWPWAQVRAETLPCQTTRNDGSMVCERFTFDPWENQWVARSGQTYLSMGNDSAFGIRLTDYDPLWRATIDGVAYTVVWFSSNGIIGFNNNLSSPPNNITENDPPDSPSTVNPDPLIAPMWEDLFPLCIGICDGSWDITRLWYKVENLGGIGNWRLTFTMENIAHYFWGEWVTMQYQLYQRDQSWHILYDQVDFDDDGDNEVIGWENHDGSSRGPGIYAVNESGGGNIGREAVIISPVTPCGEVYQLHITRDTTLNCNVFTHSLLVDPGVTLTVAAPYKLHVQLDNGIALPNATDIDGTVVVQPNATLYFDDLDRWSTCAEADPGWHYNVTNRVDTTGAIEVQGVMYVNTCPDLEKARRMFDIRGLVTATEGGIIRTVGANSSWALTDGYLVVENGGVLGTSGSGDLQLGNLYVENGGRVDLSSDTQTESTVTHMLTLVGPDSQMTVRGNARFRLLTATAEDSYVACNGLFEVEEDAQVSTAGYHEVAGNRYNYELGADCRMVIEDLDWTGEPVAEWAYLNANYGIHASPGSEFSLAGGRVNAGGSVGGYTLFEHGAAGSASISGGQLVTSNLTNLVYRNGTIVFSGGRVDVQGGHTIEADALLRLTAPSSAGPPMTGYYDTVQLEVYGDIEHTAGSPRLRVTNPTHTTVTHMYTGSSFSGSAGTFQNDDLIVYQDAFVAMTGTCGLDLYGDLTISCQASSGPDGPDPARVSLAGGSSTFYQAYGGEVTVGPEGTPPPGVCDAVLSVGGGTLTADSIHVHGNGTRYQQTGGTVNLAGDYGSTGYAFRLTDGTTATISGGTLAAGSYSILVDALSDLNMPGGGTGTVRVTSSSRALDVYGDATINSGTLDIQGLLNVSPGSTFFMADSSTATVGVQGAATLGSTTTLSAADDAGTDVTLNGAVTVESTGSLAIRGQVDVTLGAVVYNRSTITVRDWADVVSASGFENGAVGLPGNLYLSGNAEVTFAGLFSNTDRGRVEMTENAAFVNSAAFTNWNDGGTFIHDSTADSGIAVFTNSALVRFTDSGGLVAATSYIQTGDTDALTEFVGSTADVWTGYTLIDTGYLDLLAGTTWTVNTNGTYGALEVRNVGQFDVSGGTLVSNGSVAVLCNPGCGQMEVDSGTVQLTNAAQFIRVEGNQRFRPIGGSFIGGGLNLQAGATVVFLNAVRGDFTGQLVTAATSVLRFESQENRIDPPEITFATGLVSGTVVQGLGVDSAYTDVGFYGDLTISGSWAILENLSSTANRVLQARSNLVLSGGSLMIEPESEVAVTANLTLQGSSPTLGVRGLASADRIVQNAGLIQVNNPAAQLTIYDSAGHASGGHEINDGRLIITGGAYDNYGHFNNRGYPTGGGVASNVQISGGTSHVNLTRNANSWARCNGSTAKLDHSGGEVDVANDLLVEAGARVDVRGTADFAVVDRIQVQNNSSIFVVESPTAFSAGSLRLASAGRAEFHAAVGTTPTFAFSGAVGDGLATTICSGYSRGCSIQIEGANSQLLVDSNATVTAWASIYNEGTVSIAQSGTLRDLSAAGANYVQNASGGRMFINGLLDADDTFRSLGTVEVRQNAAAPHGRLRARVMISFRGSGTALNQASATIQSDDDLWVEGTAALTTSGSVIVGTGTTSNELRIREGARMVQDGGAVTVSGPLTIVGTNPSTLALLTQNAGTLSYNNFTITNGTWTVGAGVADTCTRASAVLDAAVSQVASAGTLTINGGMRLTTGTLTDGVAGSGSNLSVASGGILTVNAGGSLDVFRQLAATGTVTNRGMIAVSRSNPPAEYSAIGCVPSLGGLSCAGGGVFTNEANFWLGNELYLQGAGAATAQYVQNAPGDLRLGCRDFTTCSPSNVDGYEGAIVIGSSASFLQSGGNVTTSTGYRDVGGCGTTAAVTVQGTLSVLRGGFNVNGNLCVATAGAATIDDSGSFDNRGIVTVLGESGGTATRDGDVVLKSGSTLNMDGWGHLLAHDVSGDLGSVVRFTGYAGTHAVTVNGVSATHHFPMIQLDRAGASDQNAFLAGQVTMSGGTLWADHRVALLGRTGDEICNNGLDDDGDARIDCADPACIHFAACRDLRDWEDCNDAVDNDGDTLVDCVDPECWSHPDCEGQVAGTYGEVCGNNLDDDGDGLVDCAATWDPECAVWCGAPTHTAEVCNDGDDDDSDTLIDCADPECLGNTYCGGGFDSQIASTSTSTSAIYGGELEVSGAVRLWVTGSTVVDMTEGSYSASYPNLLSGRRVVFMGDAQLVTDKDIEVHGQVELWQDAELWQGTDRVLTIGRDAELKLVDRSQGFLDSNLYLEEYASGALTAGRLRLEHLSELHVMRADDSRYYIGGSLEASDSAYLEMPMFVIRSNPALAALGAEPAEVYLEDEAQFRSWTDPSLLLDDDDCLSPDISPYPAGVGHVVPTFDNQQTCSWIHGHATLWVTSDGGDRGGPDGTGAPDGSADGGLLTNQRIIVNVAQDETVRTTTGWNPAVTEPLGLVIMENGRVVKHDGPIEGIEDAIDIRRDSMLMLFADAELRTSRIYLHTRQNYSGVEGRAGWAWLAWGSTIQTEYFDLDGYSELAFFGEFDWTGGVVIRPFDQPDDPGGDPAVTTPTFWAPQYSLVWAPPDWVTPLVMGPVSYPGTPSGAALGHAGGSFLLPGGAGAVLPATSCDTCFSFAPDSGSGEARFLDGMAGSAGGQGSSGPGGLAAGAVWISGQEPAQVHLFGAIQADGQDAPAGGGGGASGGGVYIRAYDLAIGSNSHFSARGGDGSIEGDAYVGGGGAGGFMMLEYTDTLEPVGAFTLLRNSHVEGGEGYEPGGHGNFVVSHWDSDNGHIDDLYSTNLVLSADPALDPAPQDFHVYGNWTQVGPTGAVRGMVSDTSDLDLTVNGILSLEQTDYTQSADTVNLTVGHLSLQDTRWLSLVDPGVPESQWQLDGTLHIVSSGDNLISDDSVIAVADLDVDGASGDWTLSGSAGHPVRVMGESVAFGGGGHNIDTLHLGPFATIEGNVAVEANVSVTLADDLATYIDASEWGLEPGEPATSPGQSGGSGGGGAYGGSGGAAPGGASGGTWYDSALTPAMAASYGGNGALNAFGGAAGGLVSLVAPTCTIGSELRSNGEPGVVVGSNSGGGGAGGRIWVDCPNLALTADGTADLSAGGGASTYGGGGGGGRILIRTSAFSDFICHVPGGPGANGLSTSDDGTVGTCGMFIDRAAPALDDLYVQDGYRLQAADDTVLDLFQVMAGTQMTGVFDGTIEVNTWNIENEASWLFVSPVNVMVDTLSWNDEAQIGHWTTPPDLTIRLDLEATFNADMSLGTFTVQRAGATAPVVVFGTDLTTTTLEASVIDLPDMGRITVARNAVFDLEGTANLGPSGPGAGDDAVLPGGGGGGGGFGGMGGNGEYVSTIPAGGGYYGSSRDPAQVGGDGGRGVWPGTPPTYASGGRGGGSVNLIANRIDLAGTLNLNGANGGISGTGSVGGGGGSGGGAYFDAELLDLDPATFSLSARGGNGGGDAAYDGGSGSGGRVLFRLRDGSSGAVNTTTSLANLVQSKASVFGGGSGSTAGRPGTMAVLLEGSLLSPPSEDYLFVIQGWRHEPVDNPHTYARYDATRSAPTIYDTDQPVTLQATQVVLGDVDWYKEGSLTLVANSLVVVGSDVHCLGPIDVTTSQLSGMTTHSWTSSSLTSDAVLLVNGSTVGSWALTGSSFQAPSLSIADMNNLSIANSSVIRGNSELLMSGNLTVDSTSGFNANGYGFTSEPAALGRGETASSGGGGGGGYGGSGGNGSQGARGGLFHSSALSPYPVRGSGGGNGAVPGAIGGRGGGAISITLGGVANLAGYLQANGASGVASGGASGGGGSGGSIYLSADQLQGSTAYQANGGAAAAAAQRGGGGGGGRVLLSARNLDNFTGWTNVSIEPGAGFAGGTPGTAGVVQRANLDLYAVSSWRFEPVDVGLYPNYRDFIARPSTVRGLIQPASRELSIAVQGDVSVEAGMTWNTGGHHVVLSADRVTFSDLDGLTSNTLSTNGGNFTIVAGTSVLLDEDTTLNLVGTNQSAGTFTVTGRADLHMADTSEIWGSVVFLGSNVTTDIGTMIHANHGHREGWGPGTPGDMAVASGGSGGTFGGRGGRGSFNLNTGVPYGSEIAPTENGSGGGRGNTGAGVVSGTGGQGGGLVRIESNTPNGAVTLRGDIDVSGSDGQTSGNFAGGGGAGGSVYVSTQNLEFAASSLVDTTGGNGGTAFYNGGGGGGGRVALCYGSGTRLGTVMYGGGSGPGSADAGAQGTYAFDCTPSQPGAVVLVSTNGANLGNVEIGQTGDYPLMAFTIQEISGNEGALIDSITLTAIGTINDATQLSGLRLVLDANHNGLEDIGEAVLGSFERFSADNGQVTFVSTPITEPITPLVAIGANDSADLLVVGSLNGTVPQGLTLAVGLAENGDMSIRGDLTLAYGQVVGAPVLSGDKTTSASPLPAVSSFVPMRHSSATGFWMDVYGINFAPNPATNPLSAQIDSWTPTVFADIERTSPAPTNNYFRGYVPAAPSVHPGFYNVQVVTEHGMNLESVTKFEFFEYCDTGLQGVCQEGELVGSVCAQVNFPGTEICGNDIDEDCSGSDLSCTGTDDDHDGYAEDDGDCNDDPTDPQAAANNPGMGLICIENEQHLTLTQLSGLPRNIAVRSLADDTRSSEWRNRPVASWYQLARDVLRNSHLVLDGGGDYVAVQPSLSLGPEAYLTVMAWVQFQGVPASNVVLAFKGGDDPGTWEYGLYYHRTSGQFRFVLGTQDGNHYERGVSAALVLNHWFQVVGTYNSATGAMRIYLDGNLVDSVVLPGGPAPLLGDSPLYVGGHAGAALGSINGLVDEVRVFGRVLSNTEIGNDNSSLRSGLQSPIGLEQERLHLSFDFGTFDESVRRNDGVAHGDAAISGRSGRYEFPALAFTVSTSNGVDLYDENHELWMRIPVSTLADHGALQSGNIDYAEMANGVLAVASADPDQGVVVFDFPLDRIYRINSSGRQQYEGDFGTLLGESYGSANAAWSIPDSAITGLDIESDGGDLALIGVGQEGFITALDLGSTAGAASKALPASSGPASGLTFGEPNRLYYGYVDASNQPHYNLIDGVLSWISASNRGLGVSAIDLPVGVTAINDASFTLADESPVPRYILTVAHDHGMTWGYAAPTVASGDRRNASPPLDHCPTGDVISVWNDFDSRYSACAGAGGGITHYDYNLLLRAEFIDDSYETNIVGRLPTLDIVGVAGYSNIAVAHGLGVSFFGIPLAQGDCTVAGELGECAEGQEYPIESGDLLCVQTTFEEHEYCGEPDTNCDGNPDPINASTCLTGVPWVSVQPDISVDIIGCDPIEVDLPDPIVADDTDPAPQVSCWTDKPDPVVINGTFGDWNSSHEVGTSASGLTAYSVQYTEKTLSIRMYGTPIEGNSLGFHLAIAESDDGVGCTVPTGEAGAAFQGPAVLPDWLFSVDDRRTLMVMRCDPLNNTFEPVAMTPLVATDSNGLEMKIDLSHTLFAGTELSDPNGLNYLFFWIYDRTLNRVSETFPQANPTGLGPKLFIAAHPLQRTVMVDNMMDPGLHRFGCSATDFDGNVGSDEISIVITKTSSPVISPPQNITAIEATTPAGTYVQIRCEGGGPTAPHDPACPGGTIKTDAQIAPDVPENCSVPLQVTNNAPSLFQVGITSVTWRVTDSTGFSSTANQQIKVVDTTAPQITFPIIPGVTEQIGAEVWQYIPYRESTTVQASELVTPLCTDNGDPNPTWFYLGMPINLDIGFVTAVICNCVDDLGNVASKRLWLMMQPPTTEPPRISDLTPNPSRFFNDTTLFSFEVEGHPACPPPTVTFTFDFVGTGDVLPNVEDTYYFSVSDEGYTDVQVMATSSCYDASSIRSWTIGIDRVPPEIEDFDDVDLPLATDDDSFFKGFFPGEEPDESTPTFLLTGDVSDVGCGLESVTATLVFNPFGVNPPPETVTLLIDPPITLGGSPLTGVWMFNNLGCQNPSWCDDEENGVKIPKTADMGPYRIDVVALDCAGNSASTAQYFYALDLEKALERMLAAIGRYVSEPAGQGITNLRELGSWSIIEPMLLDMPPADVVGAQPTYDHALAAYVYDEFPTTLAGLYEANYSMKGVGEALRAEYMGTPIGTSLPPTADDSVLCGSSWVEASSVPEARLGYCEIRDKLSELAVGARIATRDRYDYAVETGMFIDEEQREQALSSIGLATSASLNTAHSLVNLRNAEVRRYLGVDGDLWDLDQAIEDQGVNISFAVAMPVLDSAIDTAEIYIDHAGLSGDLMMGSTGMTETLDELEDIWFVMHCASGFWPPEDCINQFEGYDPSRPNSQDLAENVVRLLRIQGNYQELANYSYVATFEQQYRMALTARVAIIDGLDNSAGNICDGWEHPLIDAAKIRWQKLELLRDDIIDPELVDNVGDNADSRMREWSTLATDMESICLAVFVYNAAYITDTMYVDMNWYRGDREHMQTLPDQLDENLFVTLCNNPPADSSFDQIRLWRDMQDSVRDCECACTEYLKANHNTVYCPAECPNY